jgi:DNA-binding SARP family transcriptional activator
MSVLEVNVLGIPELRYGDTLFRVPLRKAMALLAYLAIDGAAHPRDELVALFWPDADERNGRMTLRTCLAGLRRILQGTDGLPGILRTDSDTVGLDLGALLVDARDLAGAAMLAQQPAAPPGLRARLERAIARYRGALLHGLSLPDAPEFELWALAQRETCHRQLSIVLGRLATLQAAAGDFAAAVATVERWMRHEPLEEAACRQLMATHLELANPAAGLRAYAEYRARLVSELGVEPGLEIQALAQRLEAAIPRPESARARPDFTSGPLRLPLTGRATELIKLRKRYEQARAGHTQLVVLEGEAGIGKTRLAQEFIACALGQEAQVLEGRAVELGGAVPFAAVIEALRPRVERENAPEDLVDGIWLTRLARLLPELCERYPDLSGVADTNEDVASGLYEAVVRLTQALAEQAPLVLFLDDLQWADPATRSLLLYAARRWAQCSTRLLLLLASRSEEGSAGAADDWLAQLDREAFTTRLALGPLRESATTQLVEALLGAEATSTRDQARLTSIMSRFGTWLQAASGGRPFCMVELLQRLLETGGLVLREATGGAWVVDARSLPCEPGRLCDLLPVRWHEVVRGQVARLDPAARELLLAGTVLGPRFAFEHLCSVAAVPEHAAMASLDALVRAGMLREEEDTEQYSFSYSALQAALHAQLGTARRHVFTKRAQALHGVAEVTTAAEPPRAMVAAGHGVDASCMAWQLTARHEQPTCDWHAMPESASDDAIQSAIFQPLAWGRVPLAG